MNTEIINVLTTEIYKRAAICRAFEESVFARVKNNLIKIPVYLSAGQEYAPATISALLDHLGVNDRQIFIQHRGHSTYLSFGGNLTALIYELLGHPSGCASGMGGSASIHSPEANIVGHDGLMGTHGPIAVGMCYANRRPTIVFSGDAAAEEDYFLTAIGWAATKKLPILFVIEDNNLSILTEKQVRRSWHMHDVAKGFGIKSFNINDDPTEIINCLENPFSQPILLNINTHRLFWHAGAGIDDPETFDRHRDFGNSISTDVRDSISSAARILVEDSWTAVLSHFEK